jgi:hypothetical protein
MSPRLPLVVEAASAVSISFDCAAVGCVARPVPPITAAAPLAPAPAISPRRVVELEPFSCECEGSELSSAERLNSGSVTAGPPGVAGG